MRNERVVDNLIPLNSRSDHAEEGERSAGVRTGWGMKRQPFDYWVGPLML
ncbi:hypothetical protein RKD55_003500 [Rossellomorea marisflavi]